MNRNRDTYLWVLFHRQQDQIELLNDQVKELNNEIYNLKCINKSQWLELRWLADDGPSKLIALSNVWSAITIQRFYRGYISRLRNIDTICMI
jgi:hypothetical protein